MFAEIPTGAAVTAVAASSVNLMFVVVTTAGSGTGNVTFADGHGNVVFQIPATVTVNTSYPLCAGGLWFGSGLNVTNVASGPVLSLYYA